MEAVLTCTVPCMVLAGYLAYLAFFLGKSRKCTGVLRSPDARELTAEVRSKEPMLLRYYSVVLEFAADGGKKTVHHVFTRNYIDNYRPELVPVVYSKRMGLTATKGQHEMRLWTQLFALFTAAAAVAVGVSIYWLCSFN